MRNNGHAWGFTIHKKRGTTNVGDYYAVLPVSVILDILDAALVNTELLKRYDQKFVENAEALESPAPVKRKRVIPRFE